jgi:hypothetical protein
MTKTIFFRTTDIRQILKKIKTAKFQNHFRPKRRCFNNKDASALAAVTARIGRLLALQYERIVLKST